jgi:hypothetical protein
VTPQWPPPGVRHVLSELQAHYAAWPENLPENLHAGATVEALRVIVQRDLSDLPAIEPPRGFGRD